VEQADEMKSEIRNPKSEGNPKTEIRKISLALVAELCGLSDFDFRISDFLRISDFGFRISPLPL
jgi:hypothetical protein